MQAHVSPEQNPRSGSCVHVMHTVIHFQKANQYCLGIMNKEGSLVSANVPLNGSLGIVGCSSSSGTQLWIIRELVPSHNTELLPWLLKHRMCVSHLVAFIRHKHQWCTLLQQVAKHTIITFAGFRHVDQPLNSGIMGPKKGCGSDGVVPWKLWATTLGFNNTNGYLYHIAPTHMKHLFYRVCHHRIPNCPPTQWLAARIFLPDRKRDLHNPIRF